MERVTAVNSVIDSLLDEAETLRRLATKSKSVLNLGGADKSSRIEFYVEKILELEAQIIAEIQNLVDAKTQTISAISKVKDNELRALLLYRYVNGYTWEKVAEKLHYSYAHVVKSLHPKALEAVEHYA